MLYVREGDCFCDYSNFFVVGFMYFGLSALAALMIFYAPFFF